MSAREPVPERNCENESQTARPERVCQNEHSALKPKDGRENVQKSIDIGKSVAILAVIVFTWCIQKKSPASWRAAGKRRRVKHMSNAKAKFKHLPRTLLLPSLRSVQVVTLGS